MATKSKFFRVFVEGDSVDGREIKGQDIKDIADTYNPATYGARVNLEHMRGLMADGPFQSLGDVTAVKYQLDDMEIGGKTQKRLALYAQIEPLPGLIEINKKRQKIYTSVEISPNFANTGKAGLVGLAITDSPASLGTEVLAFAAQNPKANPFADRKTNPDNVFGVAHEVTFDFVDDQAGGDKTEAKSTFATLKELFSALLPEAMTKTEVVTRPKTQDLTDKDGGANAVLFTKGLEALAQSFDAGFAKVNAAQTALAEAQKSQAEEFKTLKSDLEKAPSNYKGRSKATGQTDTQTDC